MVIIQEAHGLDSRIELCYSPLSDLALALDLLCDPEHHPSHVNWVRDVQNQLSRKEMATLRSIEKVMDGYLNLDTKLNYFGIMKTAPPFTGGVQEYIENLNNWAPAEENYAPDKIIPFLSHFWRDYIKPMAEEHSNAIAEQLKEGREILSQSGAQGLLTKVSSRISFNKDVMKLDKWVESSFKAGSLDHFYLELSLFAFPHLVIDDRHDRGTFTLSWDVPLTEIEHFSSRIDQISTRAFALSDKSRLRILLMLSRQPMTQSQLTRQLGFAKSTISRHIGILQQAGLLLSSDHERNTLLSVNKEELRDFSSTVLHWLE